jgi:hypothetical protein
MNIFQRIAHRLFGWDYIAYRWGCGEVSVCRVRYMPNGRPYILWLGDVVFPDDAPARCEPLTWAPAEAKP